MSHNVDALFSLFETEKNSNGEIKMLFHGLALTVFKEKYGVWDRVGVGYNSPYLTVNSEVIYSHYKGKGMDWGRFLLLLG